MTANLFLENYPDPGESLTEFLYKQLLRRHCLSIKEFNSKFQQKIRADGQTGQVRL